MVSGENSHLRFVFLSSKQGLFKHPNKMSRFAFSTIKELIATIKRNTIQKNKRNENTIPNK